MKTINQIKGDIMRSWKRLMLVCLAVAVITAGAAVAGDLPELKFEKFELPNGLDVILHEDHSIPMVSVNIWYHVGSKSEKPRRTGFAHLFEHMMFQGSENFNTDFFEGIEKIGGVNSGSTSEDRTNYWENVPGNYLERMIWLEADRMGFLLPAMTQERLDNQKDVVKNERRQRLDNQPYAKSYELMLSLMYPDEHPYSHSVIGSMEDLSAASLEDVSGFFELYYTPNNASLCITGDFDTAQVKQWVEKYFGPIPPGAPIDRMKSWVPRLTEVKRSTAEDNVSLPRLYMEWHTPGFYAPGDAEFDLLANILTSGKNSRLYKTLVYEKQIAQDVRAYQSSMELSSTFGITVTAKEGHSLEEVETEVDAILKDVLANGITSDELEQAKTTWEAGFVRGLERIGGWGGRSDRLNRYNVYIGDPGSLQWDMERYSKATVADVMKYAREYIDLNGRAILYIIPQGDPQLVEAEFDRTAEPAAASEPSFAPPSIQKAKLFNGMDLMLVEDHDLPLVQINLIIKNGWAADPSDRPGAAALTADLLDEGTKSMDALEISDEIKRLGAQLGTGSSFDNSSVSLNVLKKNLDPALKLMSDIVLNPTFPEKELELKRENYLGRIQQEGRQPMTAAFKTYFSELFGADHPYGQPYTGSGTEASVKAITRSDLESFYQANYMPNNATAIVVGDITLDEARSKLEKAFKKWKQGAPSESVVKEVEPLGKTKICIVDKPGAPQSVIVLGNLGLKRSDPDYLATSVMNNALGGQFTARINMNLREDKGYTYGAMSFFSGRRGRGAFAAYAQVHAEFTKESIAEFVKEFRDVLSTRPLTAVELTDSKNNLIKGFPQDFQTYSGIASQMGSMVTFDLPEDEWNTYVNRVNAIDMNLATKAASDHIYPDALLIVIVGDREKIEPGIRELNLGEIEYLSASDL
jgi:zinc protease